MKAVKADVGDCEGEPVGAKVKGGGGKGVLKMKLGKLAAGTRKNIVGKQPA